MEKVWLTKWNDEIAKASGWDNLTDAAKEWGIDLSEVWVYDGLYGELEGEEDAYEAVAERTETVRVADYVHGSTYEANVEVKVIGKGVGEFGNERMLVEAEQNDIF